MFRYHFLGHFLAESNEICCRSLFNSILKNVQKEISLNIVIFFYSTKSEILSNFCCFSHKKLLKMYYATKVKTLMYVSSFVCLLSSMCLQLFTAFEEAVLKLHVPWRVP